MAKENLKSRKQYPTTVCFGLTHDDSTASSKRFSGSRRRLKVVHSSGLQVVYNSCGDRSIFCLVQIELSVPGVSVIYIISSNYAVTGQ